MVHAEQKACLTGDLLRRYKVIAAIVPLVKKTLWNRKKVTSWTCNTIQSYSIGII